jgi:hypothetical protein
MDEKRKHAILEGSRPHRIILVRDKFINHYRGYVENSFSLSFHEDRTYLYWSGKPTSNFGGNFNIDAIRDSEEELKRLQKSYPDKEFTLFDPHEEETLPVMLDWEDYLDGNERADTLSGVKNKFRARNIRFMMKDL